ncbi:histidine kinase dimerization/phospho-acceptor domain-containing protein [Thermomonas sp.]|uniref:sensor histidine kinase n=1 Tax=Thermomonas sp. TaxID=1971895 RepID=UPI0025998EA1|nr:histidine kinase dimerization/phospho-acceptor domain-containing protein [Thermomonas sp.]HQE08626.1 histidine kinase dimerization/phospho-acceptor domain-containing protein [Thermomonas sp.]
MSSNKPHRWSLRTRLLWQLVLAIGVLLGGLFLTLDALVDRAMFQQLDQVLSSRAASLARQLQNSDEPLPAVLPAWDIAGHTEFFAVYDVRGRLRAASINSGRTPLALPATTARSGNVLLPDGHRGRYHVVLLQRGAFAKGRLLVATERESWDSTERRMHGVLLLGILAAVIAAVLLCLLVVRQAFRTITREAQRLPQDGPPVQGALNETPQELQPFVEAAHAALRNSWAMAERERRVSRSVAHELRTPVAEIAAVTELAQSQQDADVLKRALTTVHATNVRMQRGIEALLALARFESGQEPPQTDPLDAAALLRQLAASLAQPRLHLQLPAEAWVVCDAGMLERIAANLLHNALEYGDADAPVQLGLQLDGGWWLHVRNRASHLREEDVRHFGERHWRGQCDGDPQHAGLGLALVLAMAHALGLQLHFDLHAGELQARLGPIPAL